MTVFYIAGIIPNSNLNSGPVLNQDIAINIGSQRTILYFLLSRDKT
jgi:hypothetical protein